MKKLSNTEPELKKKTLLIKKRAMLEVLKRLDNKMKL